MNRPARSRLLGSALLGRLGVAALAAPLLVTLIAPTVAARDPRTERQVHPSSHPSAHPVRSVAERGGRTASPLPVPNGTIGVRSSTMWIFPDDSSLVVGEVINNTSGRTGASIEVTYFDINDQEIGTSGSFTDLYLVGRGAISPFEIPDFPPAGVHHYQLDVVGDVPVTDHPAGPLNITRNPVTTEPGLVHYTGLVKNPNAFIIEAPLVAITAYDADGDVIDSHLDLPVDTVAAGGSFAYDFAIADDIPVTRTTVVADAFRTSDGAYVTTWANYFDDLFGSSFRGDIVWLAEHGITTGCTPGMYCPLANVRRDEMASFLSRAMGLSGTPPDAFSDDTGNTHELSINRIAAAGVTSGCAAGLYCPASNVRRDQMASFLSRALGLTGTPTDAFTDDTGNTHELNINRLAAAGVTTGCAANLYCPSANVTRGQMAAFLRRAFEE